MKSLPKIPRLFYWFNATYLFPILVQFCLHQNGNKLMRSCALCRMSLLPIWLFTLGGALPSYNKSHERNKRLAFDTLNVSNLLLLEVINFINSPTNFFTNRLYSQFLLGLKTWVVMLIVHDNALPPFAAQFGSVLCREKWVIFRLEQIINSHLLTQTWQVNRLGTRHSSRGL